MKKHFASISALLVLALCSGCIHCAEPGKMLSAQDLKQHNIIVTYPGWKLKALTFSYDDGNIADRKLVEIFNKYGVKGTFNIPSGWFKDPRRIKGRILESEANQLYAGHEIAGHGASHKTMTLLKKPGIELDDELKNWQRISGKKLVGYAYPYGRFNDRVVAELKSRGFVYARTCKMAGNFDLPQDFLKWHPYCHHNRVKGLAKKFIDYKAEKMSVLVVWGHSYEFPERKNRKTGKILPERWALIENFCKALSGRADIWYATMGDIALYVLDTKKFALSKDGKAVINCAEKPIYFIINGEKVKLDPGKAFELK